MLLFIYMIYVIYSLSKMKNEGKRVSILTKIVVFGLLVLSLIKMYFSFLAFLFSPLPFFGFLAALAIGGMMLSLKIVIALLLLLLSLSLFLDSKNNDPDTPLIDHWLRLGVHILLIII
ncbi:diacylglyceryl transferase [Streptococcus sp.]